MSRCAATASAGGAPDEGSSVVDGTYDDGIDTMLARPKWEL